MLTIEKLKEYGADTGEGIARCMGMEDFYLQLVDTQLKDENFTRLEEALKCGDMQAAFDAAHALKGALANLALTPLVKPITEITERLRNAEENADVSEFLAEFKEMLEGLKAL